MPVTEHPFQFVQGIAEFIPFKDETFDYVISVTALDHVLLLDRALKRNISGIKRKPESCYYGLVERNTQRCITHIVKM